MAKEMTLLWGSGSPPCWRVQIALEEKSLQGYNHKLLRFDKMEHKSQEVMDMNPRGQLPAFKHGNNVLNESYAACLYLESEFKSQGNKLIPDCSAEKALMYQRMFEGLTLNQKMGLPFGTLNYIALGNIIHQTATFTPLRLHVFTQSPLRELNINCPLPQRPEMFKTQADVIYYNWKVPEGERHDSAVKRNRDVLSAEVKLWEGYLQKASGSFLAGKNFSLADVTVYPSIAYLFHFGLCEERYPKLAAYYNSNKDRPSIKATWPPTWLENPQGQDQLKDI